MPRLRSRLGPLCVLTAATHDSNHPMTAAIQFGRLRGGEPGIAGAALTDVNNQPETKCRGLT
jgi:hypothetical protein